MDEILLIIQILIRFALIITAALVIYAFFKKRQQMARRGTMLTPRTSMPSAVTAAARQRVEPKKLDLDTKTFAPLSDEQIQAATAATGVQLWGNAWFGRRDL